MAEQATGFRRIYGSGERASSGNSMLLAVASAAVSIRTPAPNFSLALLGKLPYRQAQVSRDRQSHMRP
jgi:hypothetical protein